MNDVAPTIASSSDYTTSGITPISQGSNAPSYSVVIRDDNGDNDITSTTAVLYDSAATSLTSGTCNGGTTYEKNCYPGVSCTLSNNADYSPGAGTAASYNATATCVWNDGNVVWFNANASSGWKMHANPVDQANTPTGLVDSNSIQITAMSSIDTIEGVIAFGSLNLGADSSVQTTTLVNWGNQALDVWISGSAMTSGSNNIPIVQEEYHENNSSFGWADTPTAAGPYALVATASNGSETTGCLNRDLAIRLVHNFDLCENGTTPCTVATQAVACLGIGTVTCSKNSVDEPLYWRIRIPSNQASGTYGGSNTLGAVASNSCTGTLY